MTKHKTLFVWGAVLSVVLPLYLFHAIPGFAQSRAEKPKLRNASDISQAASLAEAKKAGINLQQVSIPTGNAAAEAPGAAQIFIPGQFDAAPAHVVPDLVIGQLVVLELGSGDLP